MAAKHPYVSAIGPLLQVIEQLRKSFPPIVTSETLKKLGLAAGNEGFVINILKYLGVLGDDGAKQSAAASAFSRHSNADFQKGFSELVQNAYADLFSLYADDAWTLEKDKLISFFRHADQTTSLVGGRQASTFQALASLSGHGIPPTTRKGGSQQSGGSGVPRFKKKPEETASPAALERLQPSQQKKGREVGLTVRVEINLPAGGDQDTYDRIFRSIRENLINGAE